MNGPDAGGQAMASFRRLVFTAVIAGLVAGSLVTVAHHFGASSIIARAEVYEEAASGPAAAPLHADHARGEAPAAADWEPEGGAERTLSTALADMLTATAFSLLLAAAMELRGGADWRSGLFWGLAGFATFTLAPGLGLPPELPGTAAAPLEARQLWWGLAAATTAGGLALLFLQRRPWLAAVGVALLAAPHVLGAPQPEAFSRAAPEALAHQFIVTVVTTQLLFWIVLGALTGHVLHLMRRSPVPARRADALPG